MVLTQSPPSLRPSVVFIRPGLGLLDPGLGPRRRLGAARQGSQVVSAAVAGAKDGLEEVGDHNSDRKSELVAGADRGLASTG